MIFIQLLPLLQLCTNHMALDILTLAEIFAIMENVIECQNFNPKVVFAEYREIGNVDPVFEILREICLMVKKLL